MVGRAMSVPPSIPPGQCRWSSYAGGYGVGCNFDQVERTALQAVVPFMVGIDVLLLIAGLSLCALGARAVAWLPPAKSTRFARNSTAVRLGGAAICVMAMGQLVSTAEFNQSLTGGHPARFGTAIVMGAALLVWLVVLMLIRARRTT
jgi:hypothetical protein